MNIPDPNCLSEHTCAVLREELARATSDLAKATADRDRYIARVKLLENRLDAIRWIVR